MSAHKAAFPKSILFFSLVISLFITACGDNGSSSSEDNADSSSSQDDSSNSNGSSSSFQEKESDISASSYRDTSLIGQTFESDIGTLQIIKGTMYDSYYEREYKTVQIGPYNWIAENLEFAYTAFEDYAICYDKDEDNCKSEGRLFKNYGTNRMCPTGYTIPTEADYRYLTTVTKDLEGIGFNPQMAGYCQTSSFDRDSLGCTDKGKKAYLLTSGDSVFTITSSGSTDLQYANYNGFYSLRCLKLGSFVDTEKQLPLCNSKTQSHLNDIYVASKGSNYYCNGTKWTKLSDSDCPLSERGQKHYYEDTLFVCNGSRWTYATMDDVDLECTSSNQGDVQSLNGKKYICDDESWRAPTDIEKAIGLCSEKNIGTIDTIPAIESYDVYSCDSTGWRKLSILEKKIGICGSDKLGKIDTIPVGESFDVYTCDSTGWRFTKLLDYIDGCDASKHYMVADFKTAQYTCRTTNTWEKLTSIESKLGICSPRIYGTIDSSLSTTYACDSTDWHIATINDYYGPCTEAKLKTIVKFNGYSYGCSVPPTWTKIDALTEALGFCTADEKGLMKEYNSKSYYCDSTWHVATKAEYLGDCTDKLEGTTKIYSKVSYGCRNLSWVAHTSLDDTLGFCSKLVLDSVASFKDTSYKCLDSGWTKLTPEIAFGKCDSTFYKAHGQEVFTLGEDSYICNDDQWEIAPAELVLAKCTESNEGTIVEYRGVQYECTSTPIEEESTEKEFKWVEKGE